VSKLGVQSELFGELREVFREGYMGVGRLGGAQRSPEVPCMVHFWHRTGAKTGAGQCVTHHTVVDSRALMAWATV